MSYFGEIPQAQLFRNGKNPDGFFNGVKQWLSPGKRYSSVTYQDSVTSICCINFKAPGGSKASRKKEDISSGFPELHRDKCTLRAPGAPAMNSRGSCPRYISEL